MLKLEKPITFSQKGGACDRWQVRRAESGAVIAELLTPAGSCHAWWTISDGNQVSAVQLGDKGPEVFITAKTFVPTDDLEGWAAREGLLFGLATSTSKDPTQG